jgi:hypothetical protein
MKFTHVGKYREEVLDEKQEHQPKTFLERLLQNLDHLIGVVKEKQPKILARYVEYLDAQYNKLWMGKFLSLEDADVSPLIAELVHLGSYPQLARNYINYHFQLLKLPKEEKWKTEKVKITQRTYLRSALVPRYTNLQVLTDVIARAKAIKLFKHHIDEYVRWRVADLEERFQTLEELREDILQMEEEDTGSVGVVGEVEDGRLISRKDSCHWDVALEDLSDRELKYLVCCYGDFENVRMLNKRFKLAMEHTIARGDPYCSCVYYDTSITKDFKHPSKGFFDGIWPLADRE